MSMRVGSKRVLVSWTTARGFVTLALFVVLAALVEYLVVLYAISLGTTDASLLQWSFGFPGTSYNLSLSISPMFHLVPLVVIITLTSIWTYLAKSAAARPAETKQHVHPSWRKRAKGKKVSEKNEPSTSGTSRFMFLIRRTHLTGITARSALVVFLIFLLFVITVSFLAYPRLIYETVKGAYEGNPALLNFVKGTGEASASIGSAFSIFNEALLSASPSFEGFVQSLGSIIAPLASSDNAGKYLALQNVAAWFSAMVALLYGHFGRRPSRHRKR